jgi:thaumarchaeosortase
LSRDTAAPPRQSQGQTIFGINTSIAVTLVLISPVIFTLIAYPDSFSLSWNQGRGGLLFAMAFIAAELAGIRYQVSQKRFLIVVAMAALTIAYFAALPYGLLAWIKHSAPSFVSLADSWQWMWDFAVMSIFVVSSLVVLFGRKWHKLAAAGAIYLIGMAVILSLDAFFPYDSLGPLQYVVPIYLQIDSAVISFIDTYIVNVGPADPASHAPPSVATGNLIVLNGLHGGMALRVFWPSAGVHSMIIYTLVMLAFLLKMDMPTKRKLIYFAIGTIGTAAVNVVRITSLSLYALVVTTDVNQWQAFHSVAGEIMFLPWLGIYLAIIMFTENKRIKYSRGASTSKAAAV